MVLMVLEVVLVVLEGVLVVLEVTGPQVSLVKFKTRLSLRPDLYSPAPQGPQDLTGPGASGEVQDHQEHHQDDQEQLLDNFKEGFKRFKGGLRGLIRSCFSCF